MKTTLYIQNLKHERCQGIIEKRLRNLPGVDYLFVDLERGSVTLKLRNKRPLDNIIETLYQLGYPLIPHKRV